MRPRPATSSLFGLALFLGGAAGAWISGDARGAEPAAGNRFSPPAPVVRSAAHGEEVERSSVYRLLARRARVNRRRPKVPEIHPFGPAGRRLAQLARTPASHEPFGGGARARAIRSDRRALNRTPRLRAASLGRRSTWCTSVPPPAGLPRILT